MGIQIDYRLTVSARECIITNSIVILYPREFMNLDLGLTIGGDCFQFNVKFYSLYKQISFVVIIMKKIVVFIMLAFSCTHNQSFFMFLKVIHIKVTIFQCDLYLLDCWMRSIFRYWYISGSSESI